MIGKIRGNKLDLFLYDGVHLRQMLASPKKKRHLMALVNELPPFDANPILEFFFLMADSRY